MANVKMESIYKQFGNTEVIHGVDLEVDDNEFVVLVGPSGCGKSTLLRLIAGLEDVTSGEIEIDGVRVDYLPPAKRGIAMVFQSYALYPHMNVYQNMSFGLRLAKTAKQIVDQKVRDAAEVLQITELLERKPKELSGGQRQRVAIARAMILKPEFVVADEPVSMIDVSLRASILELLMSFKNEYLLSMLFITHDLSVAKLVGDKIAVMYLGKIVEIGRVEDVINNPKHPYTAALLSAVPSFIKRRFKVETRGDVPDPKNPPSGCRFHPRCPFAKDVCKREEPKLVEVEPEHYVACHYPIEDDDLRRLKLEESFWELRS